MRSATISPACRWAHTGHKLALKIIGKPEGDTVFGTTPFPTLPFYRGNPWFVPIVGQYFKARDWLDRRRG